jgi:hypothetical protein
MLVDAVILIAELFGYRKEYWDYDERDDLAGWTKSSTDWTSTGT